MTNKTTIDNDEITKFSRLASHWWDKNGALKTLHDINPVRLQWIRQYTEMLGKNILDVGCGGGILSQAMAAHGAHVTGIDAEQEAILSALAKARDSQLTINYLCTPIEEYDKQTFDAITCMEMLEHVQNPQLVINHCARLLNSGGYLLLSTINRSWQAYAAAIVAAEYVLGLLPRQTHDYDKFIKPAELAAMARHAGLEVRGLQGLSYNPLSRQASLSDSVAVNYMMACYKP